MPVEPFAPFWSATSSGHCWLGTLGTRAVIPAHGHQFFDRRFWNRNRFTRLFLGVGIAISGSSTLCHRSYGVRKLCGLRCGFVQRGTVQCGKGSLNALGILTLNGLLQLAGRIHDPAIHRAVCFCLLCAGLVFPLKRLINGLTKSFP